MTQELERSHRKALDWDLGAWVLGPAPFNFVFPSENMRIMIPAVPFPQEYYRIKGNNICESSLQKDQIKPYSSEKWQNTQGLAKGL